MPKLVMMPPLDWNTPRPVEVIVPDPVIEVAATVFGVVAPTVPFRGPAKVPENVLPVIFSAVWFVLIENTLPAKPSPVPAV